MGPRVESLFGVLRVKILVFLEGFSRTLFVPILESKLGRFKTRSSHEKYCKKQLFTEIVFKDSGCFLLFDMGFGSSFPDFLALETRLKIDGSS